MFTTYYQIIIIDSRSGGIGGSGRIGGSGGSIFKIVVIIIVIIVVIIVVIVVGRVLKGGERGGEVLEGGVDLKGGIVNLRNDFITFPQLLLQRNDLRFTFLKF